MNALAIRIPFSERNEENQFSTEIYTVNATASLTGPPKNCLENIPQKQPSTLLPVPHPRNLRMPHLFLQLEDTIHQRLARRWTSRYIDIHRYNPIASSGHAITVVIVAAAIGAGAHTDHPPRVWHLIVHLPQSGRHLICKSTCNDHDVRLSRRGAEDYAQSVLIVAGCGEVHHFDGTAGEAEGHGPEGRLASPVCYLVECCSVITDQY